MQENGAVNSRPGRRVTSAEVAREAGVSRATVSYVLNDVAGQSIPANTRKRVRDAARRLGYTPSASARALRTGKSPIVLCLLPDWSLPRATTDAVRMLTRAFEARNLVLVAFYLTGDNDPELLWASLNPTAVLVFDQVGAAQLRRMTAAGVNHVASFEPAVDPAVQRLQIDQSRTGGIQASHLIARGHRRLAYAWPEDARTQGFAANRLRGVREECLRQGLPEPTVVNVPLDADTAAAAVRSLHASGVTAVCAYDDDIALTLLAGARICGVAVPDEFAIIGVDDVPAAAMAYPPLSTVAYDYGEYVEFFAEAVLCALEGTPPPPEPGADAMRLIHRRTT